MYTSIVTYKPQNGKTIEEVEASFQAVIPTFSNVPGLICKYFCFDDEAYEGTSVYIWESLEAAKALFENPVFGENFQKSFGCVPSIKYVGVKLVVDNT